MACQVAGLLGSWLRAAARQRSASSGCPASAYSLQYTEPYIII